MHIIDFPFEGHANEMRLNTEVLPIGFRAEMENERSFRVVDEHRAYVGWIEVQEDHSLRMSFLNPTASGLEYVQGFGVKHPTHNPTTEFWGIVYFFAETGFYQLDKKPWRLISEALEATKHTGKADAYLVNFVRGGWETNWLTYTTKQRILPGGQLLANTGPGTLELGNIENEQTM